MVKVSSIIIALKKHNFPGWHKGTSLLKTVVGFFVATKRDYLVLTGLYSFHLITTYIWLKLDTLPLDWDSAEHYLKSLQICDLFGFHSFLDVLNPMWLRHLPETAYAMQSIWPPLSHAVVTPFYTLFGKEPDTATLIQYAIFYSILIFSVYGIGKKLFNRNTGLLASFIVTMYPIVLNPLFTHEHMGRAFNIDIPLAAMVSLSLYTLLLTEHFRNRKYSILFGITLGLGWLTKFTFPLWVIGPVALIVITSLMEMIREKGSVRNMIRFKGQIPNILCSLIAFASIAIHYWLVNSNVFALYLEQAETIVHGGPYIFHLNMGITFLFLILAIIALLYVIYLVISKSIKLESVIFLLLWFTVSYVILTITSTHQTRYLMPILPAVALVSAVALEKIRFNKLKAALISLVVIFGLVQFFAYSYGTHVLPRAEVTVASYPFYLFPGWGTQGEPWQGNSRALEVVEIIKDDWDRQQIPEELLESKRVPPASIDVIPFHPRVSLPIMYYSYLYGLPLEVNRKFGITAETYEDFTYGLYVLTYGEDEGVWSADSLWAERCQSTQELFLAHIDDYELLDRVELYDSSKLLIYRNRRFIAAREAIIKSGLGKYWQPDTDTVAITSIHSDKLSYEVGERMTVTIGLKNIDDIPHDGKIWWELLRCEYKLGQEGSTIVGSEGVVLTLNVGEEKEISMAATIPREPGSYELAVAVQVYTTAEHDETTHGDVAYQLDNVGIVGTAVHEPALDSGLGKYWQPDTDTVAITSIHSDKLSYEVGERMTVTIGLKNIDDIPHDGKIWWELLRPEYKLGQEGATIVGSEGVAFTLGAGEEGEVSLAATIPLEPGSYELAVAVQVYTTAEHDETAHGDVAHQLDTVDIEKSP